jgi:hypothetical protein
MIANNSTNINKTSNHLSPQIIEHEKGITTSDMGNTGPDLVQAQTWLMGSQHSPPDNWISSISI